MSRIMKYAIEFIYASLFGALVGVITLAFKPESFPVVAHIIASGIVVGLFAIVFLAPSVFGTFGSFLGLLAMWQFSESGGFLSYMGFMLFALYLGWVVFELGRHFFKDLINPDYHEQHKKHKLKFYDGARGFDFNLPAGWQVSGPLQHPEFKGPNGEKIKVAVGPISPIPSFLEQKANLERIAAKYKHDVIETGEINVQGKKHATMLCTIPGVGIIKNYSLILDGIEYLITAQGDLTQCDSIVRTFRKT